MENDETHSLLKLAFQEWYQPSFDNLPNPKAGTAQQEEKVHSQIHKRHEDTKSKFGQFGCRKYGKN